MTPAAAAEWDEASADRTPAYYDPTPAAARLPTVDLVRPVIGRAGRFLVATIGGWLLVLGFLVWLQS